MKKRYTEEQIIGFLKQASAGTPIKELRKFALKLISPPPGDGDTFVVPTQRACATSQEAAMTLYAACDLHSNNTVLAVVDASGELRYRKRLPNDLPTIHAALAPFRAELHGVAVESTYNAY